MFSFLSTFAKVCAFVRVNMVEKNKTYKYSYFVLLENLKILCSYRKKYFFIVYFQNTGFSRLFDFQKA